MSTSTAKPRDAVADLLLQLSRDEKVTKTQLKDANTYYSSIVSELKSCKDYFEIGRGTKNQDTPNTKTDSGTLHSALEKLRTENSTLNKENGTLHSDLEKLRTENNTLKEELETIKKEKQELVEKNAGHQDSTNKLREECKNLKQQPESLKDDHSATKKEIEHYKNKGELEKLTKNDPEQSLTKLKEDNESLRHELEAQKTNFQKAKEELEHYQEKEKLESKTDIATKHQEKEKLLNDLRVECEHYKQQLESFKATHSETKQEIEHYKNQGELDKKAKNGIEQSLGQQQGYSRAMEKLRKQNQQLNEEKDRLLEQIRELRNRLSVIAAHKLTDGNPGIADLSDSYRPTKLAEMFRQLYDDEWTHAFEELETHFTNKEEEVIDILVKIIKDADQFCERVSKQQYDSLKHFAKLVMLEPCYQKDGKEKQHMTCGSIVVLSKTQEELIDKLLKDFRKSLGSLSKKRLVKIIHDECLSKFMWNGKMVPVLNGLDNFLDTTVELVWMMKIQDPPMEFAWSMKGTTFDKNMYTPYTIRGNTVAQCVWPAVVLHRGGPLMSKGVVQGK